MITENILHGIKCGKRATAVRLTARLISLCGLLFALMFVLGEGIPPFRKQPIDVQIELAATAFMLTGLLAGWKWEWLGSLLILFGWLLFLAAEKTWPPLPFTLFLVPAALFAYSGYLSRIPRTRSC